MAWLYANDRVNIATRLGMMFGTVNIEHITPSLEVINSEKPKDNHS
ncbi:hypothetical protein [Providencia rettgeri]|nr:hypothetical protein [Providencia rettgeri]